MNKEFHQFEKAWQGIAQLAGYKELEVHPIGARLFAVGTKAVLDAIACTYLTATVEKGGTEPGVTDDVWILELTPDKEEKWQKLFNRLSHRHPGATFAQKEHLKSIVAVWDKDADMGRALLTSFENVLAEMGGTNG